MRGLEHDLGALEVRGERTQGVLHDQPDPDSGRQVDDDVTLVDQLVHHQLVEHRPLDEAEVGVRAHAVDVRQSPGGEVVERDHVVAPPEQALDEMRADEAGAAGHQIPGHGRRDYRLSCFEQAAPRREHERTVPVVRWAHRRSGMAGGARSRSWPRRRRRGSRRGSGGRRGRGR